MKPVAKSSYSIIYSSPTKPLLSRSLIELVGTITVLSPTFFSHTIKGVTGIVSLMRVTAFCSVMTMLQGVMRMESEMVPWGLSEALIPGRSA